MILKMRRAAESKNRLPSTTRWRPALGRSRLPAKNLRIPAPKRSSRNTTTMSLVGTLSTPGTVGALEEDPIGMGDPHGEAIGTLDLPGGKVAGRKLTKVNSSRRSKTNRQASRLRLQAKATSRRGHQVFSSCHVSGSGRRAPAHGVPWIRRGGRIWTRLCAKRSLT